MAGNPEALIVADAAPSPASRASRLAKLVAMLERGEAPYPQAPPEGRSLGRGDAN